MYTKSTKLNYMEIELREVLRAELILLLTVHHHNDAVKLLSPEPRDIMFLYPVVEVFLKFAYLRIP